MSQDTHFFAEFQPVDKAKWLERITRDLKGKPLEDLYWHLNETLTVDPFGHPDDQLVPPLPIGGAQTSWEISESMEPGDPAAANRQALEALAFGAEGIHFPLGQSDTAAELEVLLDRIHPDYIGLQFSGAGVEQGPAAVLAVLAGVAEAHGLQSTDLRGALYYDPAGVTGQIRDPRYLADLLDYAQNTFPGFRCITVDGRPVYRGPKAATDELAAVLQRALLYLQTLKDRGHDLNAAAASIQVSFFIGKSYFVEMAKLRAFQLLWFNLLQALGGRPKYPYLDVHFAPAAYTDDLYTNMIAATTMSMSAVLGGASRLTVLPYDSGREEEARYPKAFSRRIARNAQHLLKMESGFETLTDPAAGSYYIEKLTAQLAAASWKKLQAG
ncbi:MAG: hypothetical protein EP344_06620 [Bacteroidetes bacterium]|nr:MAG: hypothetical protein EP344_06620 [Bacteroidota bacterium]